jgi:hypothetical protein
MSRKILNSFKSGVISGDNRTVDLNYNGLALTEALIANSACGLCEECWQTYAAESEDED